jgi:hypothetical protein
MTDPRTDPNQTLMQILQPGGLKSKLFTPTSRYYNLEPAAFETEEGKTIVYISRRFCPSPDKFALLQEHTVSQGDRLDNITAKYLTDPEQFWRICDANAAMNPEGLIETGRKLRITLPEGIPGIQNA